MANTMIGLSGMAVRAGLRVTVVAAMLLMGTGCANNSAQGFDSPEAGVAALVSALRPYDQARATAVLGADADEVLSSGDAVADDNMRDTFLDAYERKHSIAADGGKATLVVGDNDWPMPIPLVKSGSKWRFDTAAGKEEILNRRIGKNELSTIEVCRAIVDAQREYAEQEPGRAYAPKFISDPGTRNGLYWEAKEGEPLSPLGELVAGAVVEGYPVPTDPDHEPQPYHGYHYKMLRSQGPGAPGGARSYVERGRMTGGFGVVAWPADYGNSGVMTFIVNQDGVVFQQDLGEDTDQAARGMSAYEPDEGWEIVP